MKLLGPLPVGPGILGSFLCWKNRGLGNDKEECIFPLLQRNFIALDFKQFLGIVIYKFFYLCHNNDRKFCFDSFSENCIGTGDFYG